MKLILSTLIKRYGWNAIFKAAWNLGKPYLKKVAAKTSTKLDDQAIELIDDLINGVAADSVASGLDDRSAARIA